MKKKRKKREKKQGMGSDGGALWARGGGQKGRTMIAQ